MVEELYIISSILYDEVLSSQWLRSSHENPIKNLALTKKVNEQPSEQTAPTWMASMYDGRVEPINDVLSISMVG